MTDRSTHARAHTFDILLLLQPKLPKVPRLTENLECYQGWQIIIIASNSLTHASIQNLIFHFNGLISLPQSLIK